MTKIINLEEKIRMEDIHEVEQDFPITTEKVASARKRKLIRPIFAKDLLCFTTLQRKIVTLPLLSHKTYRDQGIKILLKTGVIAPKSTHKFLGFLSTL